MADREVRSEAVYPTFTYWAYDYPAPLSILAENVATMPFGLNLAPGDSFAEGASVGTEQTGTAIVEGPQDDTAMTSTSLNKSDWRKLAIAGTGSIVIGAGAFLSPLVPIGAVALGAAAVVVAGLRGARH